METIISYRDIHISVPKEVADFLNNDKKRQAAERKRKQRYLSKSDFETVLAIHNNNPVDPVFNEVSRNLSLESLRKAVSELPLDEQKLISLRFCEELTLEDIGNTFGVSKTAITKRLNRIFARLRVSLTGDSQFLYPYISSLKLVYKSSLTVLYSEGWIRPS